MGVRILMKIPAYDMTRPSDPEHRSLKQRLVYTIFSATLIALAARAAQMLAERVWERATGTTAPRHVMFAGSAGSRLGRGAAAFLEQHGPLRSRFGP